MLRYQFLLFLEHRLKYLYIIYQQNSLIDNGIHNMVYDYIQKSLCQQIKGGERMFD